eukprot:SAG22_NODE_2955_length_2078_cov_2.058110_1_plen_66_part_10
MAVGNAFLPARRLMFYRLHLLPFLAVPQQPLAAGQAAGKALALERCVLACSSRPAPPSLPPSLPPS